MICFADLKKYRFTYQFAFPVLHSDPSWIVERCIVGNPSFEDNEIGLGDCTPRLTGLETTALVDSVQTWRYEVDARQYGFFLAKKTREPRGEDSHILPDDIIGQRENAQRPDTPETPIHNIGFTWVIGSLGSYETGFFNGTPLEDQFVCFADPSTYPTHPGWMLRNLLILIRIRWKLDKTQILCYRDVPARRDDARSIILRLASINNHTDSSMGEGVMKSLLIPKVTGWERNAAGKVSSKIANLGDYMDPQR